MSDNNKPRRLMVPLKRSLDAAIQVDRVEGVDNLLARSLGILDEQLTKIGLQSKHSIFGEKEARVLQGYIKSLVDLSKEEREREKAADDSELKNLTHDQLLELAQSKLSDVKTK
jgi:hypothetical protein